ncbi:MAG: MBL fold metallo-hydrolase [Planctomycetota bacterium]
MTNARTPSRRTTAARPAAALVLAAASAGALAQTETSRRGVVGFLDRAPSGFIAPPIDPTGSDLVTQELAPGVYALVNTKPPADNSGFVVGEHGVLVIDSHLTREMAELIQTRVREVTDKPILYLVNTNYHGDHTYGNAWFPDETVIIGHEETRRLMDELRSDELRTMIAAARGRSVLGQVEIRLPDVTFTDRMTIDLGGRIVEIHHFGHANTPGDAVVFVPEASVAWTGNFVIGEGFIPPLLDGRPRDYLNTLAAFSAELSPRTIIPGHGLPTDHEHVGMNLNYLNDLLAGVEDARARGLTLEQTLAEFELPAAYRFEAGTPFEPFDPFVAGLHRLHVKDAYLEAEALGGE